VGIDGERGERRFDLDSDRDRDRHRDRFRKPGIEFRFR
jgi:hypothetical protein